MPTGTSPRARRWRSRRCSAGPNTSRRAPTVGPWSSRAATIPRPTARAPAVRREHGLSTADGIDCSSAGGRARRRRPRSDRHDGAVSEPRPLRADARRPRIRRGLRPALQPVDRRLLRVVERAAARHRGDADRARRRRDRHHARGKGSRTGRHPHPAGVEDPQPRPPRPRPVLRGRRRARHAARHPRRARHASSEDRRRPLHELHPGALHQLSVRPDDGDDGAGLRRCLRPASRACASRSSRPASAGCRSSSTGCTSISRSAATGSRTAGSATRRSTCEAGNIWATCEPEEPILPGVIDVLGDDFIMFASDYPHWDGEWPESTKHLRTRPDISEETRAKIGGQRPALLRAQLEREIDDAADDLAVELIAVAAR